MPQDPLTIAVVGASAVVAAQIIGQSIATFFGTRAAAQISRRTALDVAEANERSARAIAEIQRETQRILARDGALREFRQRQVRGAVEAANQLMRVHANFAAGVATDDAQSLLSTSDRFRSQQLEWDFSFVGCEDPAVRQAVAEFARVNNEMAFAYRRSGTPQELLAYIASAQPVLAQAFSNLHAAAQRYIFGA